VQVAWGGESGISSADVFISHQYIDTDAAVHAASIVQRAGVSAYVDVWDPDVQGDSPTLEVHLRSIIRGTSALLVIATPEAKESWWVAFEIGAAREAGKLLSSQIDQDNDVPLPSYLKIWPIIPCDKMLEKWANDVRQYLERGAYDVDMALSTWKVDFSFERLMHTMREVSVALTN
jgi:hypothetical protein